MGRRLLGGVGGGGRIEALRRNDCLRCSVNCWWALRRSGDLCVWQMGWLEGREKLLDCGPDFAWHGQSRCFCHRPFATRLTTGVPWSTDLNGAQTSYSATAPESQLWPQARLNTTSRGKKRSHVDIQRLHEKSFLFILPALAAYTTITPSLQLHRVLGLLGYLFTQFYSASKHLPAQHRSSITRRPSKIKK